MQEQISGQKIFDSITSIIATQQFRQAQTEFFDKNCHNFESIEENKHIYQQIHQEYQQIIDTVLESQLMQLHSEQEISEFFEQFSDNYKLYKNQETIDTLFSFTDFDQFKKMMVEYNSKDSKIVEENKVEGMDVSKNADIGIYEKYFNKDINQWDSVLKGKTKYELSLYTTPFESSGLNMARANIYFKGVSFESAKFVIFKIDEKKMRINSRIKELKVIKDNDQEQIVYFRVSPPVITERESLIRSTCYDKGPNKALILSQTIEHQDYPLNTKYIRAEQFRSVRLEKEGEDIKLDVIAFNNFKGYIPKMFMNMMISKLVSQIMKTLYERALNRDKEKGIKV